MTPNEFFKLQIKECIRVVTDHNDLSLEVIQQQRERLSWYQDKLDIYKNGRCVRVLYDKLIKAKDDIKAELAEKMKDADTDVMNILRLRQNHDQYIEALRILERYTKD